MPVSIKDIAALMSAHRKSHPTGHTTKVEVAPGPLWTAEQFMESMNSSIKIANDRRVPRHAPIEPVTLEQATSLLSGRDPFNSEQYAVFERWAESRLGFGFAGVIFAPPPGPMLKLSDVIPSLVLPLDVDAAGEFAFNEETKPLKETKFDRVAGKADHSIN